jgi:hypothetical protein
MPGGFYALSHGVAMKSLFESCVLLVVLLNLAISVGMLAAFARTIRGDVDSLDHWE